MNGHMCYKNLGGVVSEKEYESAFSRNNGINGNGMFVNHAKLIADFAGIKVDEATLCLYATLRKDVAPPNHSGYHYSQMSDQKLFAETLLMLGDVGSYAKIKEAHGNIFTS